jgi:hypothetical protein
MFLNRLHVVHVRGLVGLTVLVVFGMLAGLSPVRASNPDTDYAYGSVGGVAYTGKSYLSWGSGGGGLVYQGNGSTWTNSQVDVSQIAVDNYGQEWCSGYFIIDEDWLAQDDETNHWFAYGAGSGWAMIGECTGYANILLQSESVHPVWEDPYFDLEESAAWDQTPF